MTLKHKIRTNTKKKRQKVSLHFMPDNIYKRHDNARTLSSSPRDIDSQEVVNAFNEWSIDSKEYTHAHNQYLANKDDTHKMETKRTLAMMTYQHLRRKGIYKTNRTDTII
jgi:hypothetical protein